MRKLVIRIATDNLTWAAGACKESSSAARYRKSELNEAYHPSGDHALGNVATPGGNEVAAPCGMTMGEHMAFIQLIEITSSRVSEIEALTEEWQAQTEGQRTAVRGTLTQDRDRPGTYLQIVEFGSYEDAMANSRLPATTAFAAQLAALCDGPPVFRNLDVISVEEM
jgi:quinol monooxygenase YgiN